MKNQPNDMVTFEWLLPLFNQQLSQVADGWQLGEKSADYEEIAKSYHQIGGALTMINLPALASLANKLSLLAAGGFDSKADLKDNPEISIVGQAENYNDLEEILAKKIHSARINLFFGAGLAACSFFVFRVDWVQARSGARVDEHIS